MRSGFGLPGSPQQQFSREAGRQLLRLFPKALSFLDEHFLKRFDVSGLTPWHEAAPLIDRAGESASLRSSPDVSPAFAGTNSI
jgi:hypothetical protein